MNVIFCTDHHVGKFQKLYGTQLCKIEGCFERAGKVTGLCEKHIREIIHGHKPRPLRSCSVEGCKNKHWQHDYCRLHWSRVERTGSPNLKPKAKPEHCSVTGCEKNKRFTKGYCDFHYQRLRRGIPLDFQGRPNKGERNHNWKGGIADYPNHWEMKKTRKQKILDMQGKCSVCGFQDKPPYSHLNIHHIDGSKDNHAYDNLIVCCHKCACKFHRGRKNKTSKILRLYGCSLEEMIKKFGGTPGKYRYMHTKGTLKEFLFYAQPEIRQQFVVAV